ncbi:MAG: HAD-IA family hydrolase, partial [Candidatus Bipolaricaulota bacterium]|nr:HAD-IA family hydrolase [Candidatus Bipolaricaulota bacterium]
MGALPVRAILLDWGGTLAPEGGEPEGKGIVEEALAALHARYVVAVATNAPKDAVGEALRKLGLARHVDHLFSADALGAAKPDPGFFRGALRSLGLPPGEAVMVGDRYEADIVGAKGAGLRAVWFNPGEVPCPLAHPVHDGEVRSLDELPPLLERPFLPDLGEALALLREQGVPENVVRHSLTVAAVAHWIAIRLRERGVPVDPLLVHRGALL